MEIKLIVGFIFGMVLGSFTKALADRSLIKRSIWGRSYCPGCKSQLKVYDLFPILSYLILKGKCRYCQKSIPLEYFLVEVLTGLLIALLFTQNIPNNFLDLTLIQQSLVYLDTFFKSFIIVVLLSVFITDIKTGLIPDRITYPAALISVVYLFLISVYKIVLFYLALKQSPLGPYLLPPASDYFVRNSIIAASPLFLGLGSALLIGLFFGGLIYFTKGRGMGGGDLKLGIFIGLILGFPNSFLAILLAFISGSIVGVVLLVVRKKHFGQTIAFGPFLSLGAILALFWGDKIVDWYLKLKLFV